MSDIKVKLERLKKERASRSGQIKDAWERIDSESGLTTKEKLEQLISLERASKIERPPQPEFDPEAKEPFRFLENPHGLAVRYGRIRIGDGLRIPGDLLTCMSHDPAFNDLDLSSAVFLDLETTGLSGGTGVIPFLTGLGYYRDDKFWVVQYFLGHLGAEEDMLRDMARFFTDMNFKSVVTYNGKAFDLPLLETRFVLNRLPFPIGGLPHLDFLFPARRLWGHKYENCRLFNLALELIGTDRAEDIPSAEIPWRYFQYIQTGNYDLIEPIIYHNVEDILSLLGVVVLGASVFLKDEDLCTPDGMDLFGAGKIMESFGDMEKSSRFYQKALEYRTSEEVALSVRKRLSRHQKKSDRSGDAVLLWKEMVTTETVSLDVLYSYRELAMYFEHRDKNYEEARRYAEEGLVASFNISVRYESDFRHRLERLKGRLKKEREQTGKEEGRSE
ncbi:MAG: ribonuclease H-like domain-containing protein [Acidobacteria bacterium]|nr:ribonuclease H-like domain-containing protein [Acidobacteriota bacterium]